MYEVCKLHLCSLNKPFLLNIFRCLQLNEIDYIRGTSVCVLLCLSCCHTAHNRPIFNWFMPLERVIQGLQNGVP